MDRLGEIRTDLIQREKQLKITFFVKDENQRNTIENNYTEINAALDPMFDSYTGPSPKCWRLYID
jgi:hypothetical protein